MVDIPPLAGGYAEYPNYSPLPHALLVHNDLKELMNKESIHKNEAWLTKFGKNAYELDRVLERNRHTKDLSIQELRTWFQHGKIKGKSLSDVLLEFSDSNFSHHKILQRFFKTLIDHDHESLDALFDELGHFLKNKNY